MLDLHKSGPLWADPSAPDLKHAYARAVGSDPRLAEWCAAALCGTDEDRLSHLLDDLTRSAMVADWPKFPLVVIDEVHGFKSMNPKVQATVRRALEFFKRGQKSLIFCVYTKTAEAIRDQLDAAIEAHLAQRREEVFGDASAFDNFRRRFFNRREPLFSLIQDHPLLAEIRGGRVGVGQQVALGVDHLRQIAALLVERGEDADSDKPDRRLLLAATEHMAVNSWRGSDEGEKWLSRVLQNCPELADKMADPAWLEAREPLSRSEARRSCSTNGGPGSG